MGRALVGGLVIVRVSGSVVSGRREFGEELRGGLTLGLAAEADGVLEGLGDGHGGRGCSIAVAEGEGCCAGFGRKSRVRLKLAALAAIGARLVGAWRAEQHSEQRKCQSGARLGQRVQLRLSPTRHHTSS